MSGRKWPTTMEEYKRLEAAAEVKYRPLVHRLTAPELTGLINVCQEAVEVVRREAAVGAGVSGTRIGR